jgi:uncharacterized pyridoxal phosphate-dependent enzyme
MNIYDQLGVRKIINGSATLTVLGGSLMPPEVLEAMQAAAASFVDLDQLQERAGKAIAELTHNPAAYVSCGAAAGLVLSTAACIAGTDPEKRQLLPDTQGMRNEIIIHRKGRVGYDFAIRQAGGRLVEIGDEQGASVSDLQAAITDRTAAVFVFHKGLQMDGHIPLEQQIELAHRHHLPLVVDAAAQLPPPENLWRFTQMGVDLVLFSGGKGLCGPQSSGLILGRPELIEACAFHACPRPFIGRPMKSGKEEIIGLLAAVRWYLRLDHAALLKSYEDQVAEVIQAFSGQPWVSAARSFPSEAGQPMPRAELTFNEAALGLTRQMILQQLYEGNPAVHLAPAGEHGIFINPQTLQPGEIHIIIRRLKEILT